MKVKNALLSSSIVFFLLLYTVVASFAETINYRYDSMNRLTRAEYSEGKIAIEFSYDKMGNRLQKVISLNNCSATLFNSLKLYVPVLTYNGASYWADLQYSSGYSFTITNAGIVSDMTPYSSCTASTLSSAFKLHSPVITYNGTSYWVDLQYADGLFTLTGAGAN